MKLFNLLTVIVFMAMAVFCFVGGFHNKIHFVFSAVCVALSVLAFFDSTGGESVAKTLKNKLRLN